MRRIAVINQKGGVGKTTTSVNLGAALAEQGRRVVLVDMDAQANLSLHLGIEVPSERPSVYTVLHGATTLAEALKPTSSPRLQVLPSNIDLSGAELELAAVIGRDNLLSDAIEKWREDSLAAEGCEPADYVVFDCPPSLGLLSVNALAAASEVVITVQTEFLALMGMSKLVEVVNLIRRRLNPRLTITGIAACLYDSRLRLGREVLGEIRKYFPGQVFRQTIRTNVKLAEAPSFAASIIEYAPDSNGAQDYRRLALEVIGQEATHPELAHLPPPLSVEELSQQPSGTSAAAPTPCLEVTVEEELETSEPPAEPEESERETSVAGPPEVEVVVLQPVPPPVGAVRKEAGEKVGDSPMSRLSRRRDAVDEELRILRAQDLPPLPPDAFEMPRG